MGMRSAPMPGRLRWWRQRKQTRGHGRPLWAIFCRSTQSATLLNADVGRTRPAWLLHGQYSECLVMHLLDQLRCVALYRLSGMLHAVTLSVAFTTPFSANSVTKPSQTRSGFGVGPISILNNRLLISAFSKLCSGTFFIGK